MTGPAGGPDRASSGWSFPYDELLVSAARIGISESDFWQLTPAGYLRRLRAWELDRDDMIEIEKARADNLRRSTAWLVSTTINWAGRRLKGSKEITVEELLNESRAPLIDDMAAARKRINKRFNFKKRFGYEL